MKTAYTFDLDKTTCTALRITLHAMDAHPSAERAARELAAKTLQLAAQLELIPGTAPNGWAVQPDRRGSVTVELTVDAEGTPAIDDDIAVELAMEACMALGILSRDG